MAGLVGLKKATVLVAEDDPQVLEVMTRIVREGGYDAIPARDGRVTWGIFERAEPPIDLVVADVVMPLMTGTELAAHVVAKQPELPVILMSAFTPGDLARRGLILSHGHLLTKPFAPGELLASFGGSSPPSWLGKPPGTPPTQVIPSMHLTPEK